MSKTNTKAPKAKAQNTTIRQTPTVEASCPVCGSGRQSVRAELPATDYAGTLNDGTRYTTIKRQQVSCDDCGQLSINKVYHFDQNQWKD